MDRESSQWVEEASVYHEVGDPDEGGCDKISQKSGYAQHERRHPGQSDNTVFDRSDRRFNLG
jgi:hypothetical protein